METGAESGLLRLVLGGIGALIAAFAPILLGYTSARPSVLGRYSVPYALVLALLLGLAIVCVFSALSSSLPARAVRGIVTRSILPWLRPGWALALAIALAWGAALVAAAGLAHVELGKSVALHALGLASLLWVTFGAILLVRTDARGLARSIFKYVIVLLLVSTGLFLCEAFLRRNPGALPARVLYELPGGGEFLGSLYVADQEITVGYRYKPGIPVSDKMLASQANLFVQQPGLLRPLPAAEDRVLLEASFVTDENGYRNARPLLEKYPVAVSGDSFTSLSIEPRPWPILLSEKLGKPVLNLGLQGYGPQSETQALRRFGLPRKPDWCIVAYFEGNDLIDSQFYDKKKRTGLGWVEADYADAGILERFPTFHLARYCLRRLLRGSSNKQAAPDAEGGYPYPFKATIAGRDVELSFSTTYLSRLDLSQEQVESLTAFQGLIDCFQELDRAARGSGSRLIVAYLPCKEHCYAPVLPAATLEKKLGGSRRLTIQAGKMQTSGDDKEAVTAPGLLSRIDGQRNAIAGRLQSEGIEVLDLTAGFQAAAVKGEQLYLTNDTHWAASGHELAAALIAERLRRGP